MPKAPWIAWVLPAAGCVLAAVERPQFPCDYDSDCKSGFYCYDDGTCGAPCLDPCPGNFWCEPETNYCRTSCVIDEDDDCADGYFCCTYERYRAGLCDETYDCYPE